MLLNSRNVVVGRYGNFVTPCEDDLVANSLRLYGEWAQLEIDTLSHFIEKGDVIIDVGAFIGTHARAFSTLTTESGKVYAFEPNSSIYSYLEENASNSSTLNIETFPFALGVTDGTMNVIGSADSNRGASYLDVTGNIDCQTIAEVKQLDSLNIRQVDFIKIDVEGMEFAVLAGAQRTVNLYQPTIFLETNSLESSFRVLEWARQRHYRSYGVIDNAFNPSNFNSEKENIFGRAMECGLLLISESKRKKFLDRAESLELAEIRTVDDLALLLLHKFQYSDEVLARSKAASRLGIGYLSPEQKKMMCFKFRRHFDKWMRIMKK